MASTTVRYESRTTIDRTPDVVFERLADLSGYDAWMHRTGLFRRCATSSGEPVGMGTAYLDATRMGTFHGEVTDFEAPSRLAFQETLRMFGSPAMQARIEYHLSEDGGRTIVDHVAVGELYGWMRFMKPGAAMMAKMERTRTLKSLKSSLEEQ